MTPARDEAALIAALPLREQEAVEACRPHYAPEVIALTLALRADLDDEEFVELIPTAVHALRDLQALGYVLTKEPA